MTHGIRTLIFAALTAATFPPQALAQADAQDVNMAACPIYRDADFGKKSGCWLVEDPVTGTRYDVSKSPTKPDWNFATLVEGKIATDQDNACGGVVLNPVRVSVLRSGCTRHMLPAEGFPGRKFVLPERNVRPMSEPRPSPSPPFEARTFALFFDFDRNFMVYQLNDYLLDQAITWIRGTNPSHIDVVGFAATNPNPVADPVTGEALREPPRLARERAEKAAFMLRRLGVDPAMMSVSWETDNSTGLDIDGSDGLVEPSRRRVEIRIRP